MRIDDAHRDSWREQRFPAGSIRAETNRTRVG